jgi:maleylpyruvate isomerase
MSLTEVDQVARQALKARQGKGARYDAPNAPAADLLLARRGTAFFARKLMELSDEALFQPSAIEGWTRAHVVAQVSYDARRQAIALEAFVKGEALAPTTDESEQLPSMELAATLPARALRHLFNHAEAHLSVCWRDLTLAHWDENITFSGDVPTPIRGLPLARARKIWMAAVKLGNGACGTDLPEQLRS